MYDIEKELKSLKPEIHTPSDDFRRKTLSILKKEADKKRKPVKLIFSLAAAVVTTVVLLITLLPAQSLVSYYTVDINPSIQFTVDAKDIVTSVSAANDDAELLL